MLVGAASQGRRRKRATAGGAGTTARGGASDAIAAEARELVRRAVGDAAGLTIKAQIRQAARHLRYSDDDWRVREAFYNRAGSWSAAALDDLRRRHAAWREAAAQRGAGGEQERPALVERHRAIGAALAELRRQVGELAAEIEMLPRPPPSP